ncbi:MAG: hypothetical protein HYZ28_04680 [Myxococcales bacterium]|nr:hypothetical protein [Myxococcales bacterium]
MATGSWDGLRLWNLERREGILLPGHLDAIYGLAFDDRGALLASASIDRSVRVVSPTRAEAAQSTRHLDRIHGLCGAPHKP